MSQRKQSKTSPKRKMSEMISEMAAGFLGVGHTIEESSSQAGPSLPLQVVKSGGAAKP